MVEGKSVRFPRQMKIKNTIQKMKDIQRATMEKMIPHLRKPLHRDVFLAYKESSKAANCKGVVKNVLNPIKDKTNPAIAIRSAFGSEETLLCAVGRVEGLGGAETTGF